MEVEMKMPDLSNTTDEITVLDWLVEPGQAVKRGQGLLEVETDKATMEVESVVTGVLKSQNARSGDVIAAGQVIAMIEVEASAADPSESVPNETLAPSLEDSTPSQVSSSSGSINPPLRPARAPGGMFARNRRAAQQSESSDSAVSMSVVQRTVARRMQESKQTVPHFYLQTSANAEPMVARRNQNDTGDIAWEGFFVCAVGKALQTFDRMGCRFAGDQLVAQDTDAVSVAIDIDGDLYVAPIAHPASKTPEQVSSEIRSAVGGLRAGDAEWKRIRPANITITNLGMANVESFIPIVNPPESSILGVGKIAPQATVIDGKVAIQSRVSLTLSVDHRVVSGRYAADFLGQIVEELESL